MTTSSDTRRITDFMRGMHHFMAGRDRAFNGYTGAQSSQWSTSLSRAYGARTYTVSHNSPMRAGIVVSVNVTAREAWIRPPSRAEGYPGDPQAADIAQVELAAETIYLDALLEELSAQGYTLHSHGLTAEALADWRDSRRSQ